MVTRALLAQICIIIDPGLLETWGSTKHKGMQIITDRGCKKDLLDMIHGSSSPFPMTTVHVRSYHREHHEDQ